MYSSFSAQISQILQKQIASKNYCLLSTVRKQTNKKIPDRQIANTILQFKAQHTQLQLLCFVSYVEDNRFHTYYDLAPSINQLLERKYNGAMLKELFIEFICLYRKSLYEFQEIVEVVIDSTRQVYKKSLENQISRNLTRIPPDAIMKNGKMYCQNHPQQFEDIDMDQNLKAKVMQALKQKGKMPSIKESQKQPQITKNYLNKQPIKQTKSKQNIPQPQRITDSKRIPKQQEQKKSNYHDKKEQTKSLPKKKLQIQSQSESQQYYRPGKQLIIFDLKQSKTAESDKMELENQGNYLENQSSNQKIIKPQNMELQTSQKHQNCKNQSQDQDSMEMMMNQMNKASALNQQKNSKPSISTKSMPAGKQTTSNKLNDFCSKFTELPTKSQPVKQSNLFTFLGKK